MKIRSNPENTQVQTMKAPVAVTARPAAAPRASAPESAFGPAARQTELARAEKSAHHVALPSLAHAGPVSLDSPEAKKALAAALEQLRSAGQDVSGFKAHSIERDELGMTHVRLDRSQGGVPLFGQQVIVHLDRSGKVAGTTGSLEAPQIRPAVTESTLTAEQAVAAAKDAFQGEFKLDPEKAPTAELVYYKGADGQYRKAFRVEVTNLQGQAQPLKMNYMVDAESGSVLRKFNAIGGFVAPEGQQGAGSAQLAAGQIIPAGTGNSMYSGRVKLGTTQRKDGTWALKDQKRGGGATWDAGNQDPASGKKAVTDKNNRWGEAADPKRQRAAIDAHYGMEMTWDMYKGVFGRSSIDGKGEALNSYVHVGQKYVNAYWDGEKMNYGDGDGKDASPLTALDVAGHEISHGLTERTAGLIYDGESGGLNEAMSDIMGTGVEYYASKRNKNVKFDYMIGEDVWTPGKKGDALRYMSDPKKDGYSIDNYKDYPKQTEVHGSSGIANNAFYLLTHGGKNRTSGIEVKNGIGMEKGLKIYYRALAYYMTPSTTFKEARAATLKAATDLYGANSAEVQRVKESWTAVGVK